MQDYNDDYEIEEPFDKTHFVCLGIVAFAVLYLIAQIIRVWV